MVGEGIMDYPGGFTVDAAQPDSMSEVVAMISQCQEQNHGLYLPMEEDHITHEFAVGCTDWLRERCRSC